jgi:hypothetical protein
MVVDTFLVGAALVASSLPAKAILDVPSARPTSLKTGDQVRVQTERRRTARAAVNSTDNLESIMPMVRRAEGNDSLVTTLGLLDRTHDQIRGGRNEEAMLTIDQAATTLERARNLMPKDSRVIDLDMRERDLRRMLNQPSLPGSKVPSDNKAKKDEPPEQEPVLPKRDILPVG